MQGFPLGGYGDVSFIVFIEYYASAALNKAGSLANTAVILNVIALDREDNMAECRDQNPVTAPQGHMLSGLN